jgi:hypothetical protein
MLKRMISARYEMRMPTSSSQPSQFQLRSFLRGESGGGREGGRSGEMVGVGQAG